ncbi:hypothetical protein NT05LI_1050, partial [Listeria ivanovii FSL F6-596]
FCKKNSDVVASFSWRSHRKARLSIPSSFGVSFITLKEELRLFSPSFEN